MVEQQPVPTFTRPDGFKFAAETPRLYLTELSVEEHLEAYHKMWSNPANLVTLPYAPMKSLAESRERLIPQTNSPIHPYVEEYAIFLKPPSTSPFTTSTPIFIGLVGVIRIIKDAPPHLQVNGLPEFGYMIEAAYQKQGLGTEAVKAFLNLYWSLERRRDIQRLVAVVDRRNIGSVRVVEIVGGVGGGQMGEMDGDVWIVQRPGFAVEGGLRGGFVMGQQVNPDQNWNGNSGN